ncbi:hypothetical protein [Mycolicibacterium sp. A43C]
MTDIIFLDTETLGLEPDAPIWEFASLRRFSAGPPEIIEFQIRHDPDQWVATMMEQPNGEQFVADYTRRYNQDDAIGEDAAAVLIHRATLDAVVVGCNPSFDLERLGRLLSRHGLTPGWHYRPLCVTTMAAGWLHGVAAREIDNSIEWGESPDPDLVNRKLPVPWSSDALSAAIGVDPAEYPRHTALGDVLWAAAQWDVMHGEGGGNGTRNR